MLGWLTAWLHVYLCENAHKFKEEVKREEEGEGRAGNALARLEAFTFLCIENGKNAEPSSANKLAWT